MGRCPRPDLAGILFPADPAGILFPAVPAGIPFLADSVGTLSLPDQNGTLSPTDLAGILFPADPAGILFPAVPAGRPIPPDPAVILFPADLAEPVTLGVTGLADAGILFPAVPAGILVPADSAELNTVGVADVAVAGEAPLVVPDVLDRPELVAMIVAGEVETVEGIPVENGDDCDDSEYKDPGMNLRLWMGCPYITEVILMIRIVRIPVILRTKIGWSGVILMLQMDIVGFSRMTGRPSCLLRIIPLQWWWERRLSRGDYSGIRGMHLSLWRIMRQ